MTDKTLTNILYCLDGYIHDHNNRNYGDADEYLRHLRNRWENFIEEDESSMNPLEFTQWLLAEHKDVKRKLKEIEGVLKTSELFYNAKCDLIEGIVNG